MQKVFFIQFLQYLEKEKRVSVETSRGYKNDIQYFISFLEDQHLELSWDFIETDHIRSWIVSLANEGKKPTVIRRRVAGLSAMFKFLQKRGEVKVNPALRIPLPKITRKLPRFISQEGMVTLMHSSNEELEFEGLRDRVVIEMLYGTGMRRSELANLKNADINWERKEVKVLGKGRKERILPLHFSLISLMEGYQNLKINIFKNETETFIVTNKGNRAYPRFIYEVSIRSLSKVTSIENKGPHLLRHTFATHLVDNGADIQSVKALLGHSSLAATQIYLHNSAERLKKIYEQAHPKSKKTNHLID